MRHRPIQAYYDVSRTERCATDMRSPPGQRLRVLLGAAMLAVEELYPPATPAG